MSPFGCPIGSSNWTGNHRRRPGLWPANANDCRVFGVVRMSTPRLTEHRLDQVLDRLGDRDRAIVATLAQLRLASGAQLQRLHFGEGRSRQTRRELQRLHDLGVVMRLDRRIGGVRSGSSGHVYALDRAGQHLAGTGGPAGGQRRRRPWTPSTPFVAHALAVTELCVGLDRLVANWRLSDQHD